MVPRRRRRSVLFASFVALVILSGLCSGGWWSGTSRGALDAEIARLRARGEPATIEDLRPPDGRAEDAGRALLHEAWAWMEASGPPETEWPAVVDVTLRSFRALPAAERQSYRAFGAAISPFVRLVARAARSKSIRAALPVRGDEPVGVRRDATLLRTMHVLRCAAIAAWSDDDPGAYLDILRVQAELASRVTVGSGFETMDSCASLAGVLLGARAVVAESTTSARDVRSAVNSALDVDAMALLRTGLRAERALWISRMRRAIGDEAGPAAFPPLVPAWFPWASRSTRTGALAWVRDMDRLLDAPDGDFVEAARRAAAWPGRADPYWAASFDQGEAWLGVARIAPRHLLLRAARLAALQRICRIALACAEYREDHGGWPASLEDVGRRVAATDWTDPFTNRAMSFRRSPGTVFVASAGTAGADVWRALRSDRGDLGDADAAERDGLVWTLRR